jgi:hypothetical protein
VLHGVTPAVELAMLEWEEGERQLRSLDLTARRRAVVERVAAELEAEIVRRVGQTFELSELAAVYASSEAWCLDVAQQVTPEPWAYDLSVVQPAAFARVARSATDFRGTA